VVASVGAQLRIYYIGPESKVYHVDNNCGALNTPWRYWGIHVAVGKKAEKIVSERRPCKRCVPK